MPQDLFVCDPANLQGPHHSQKRFEHSCRIIALFCDQCLHRVGYSCFLKLRGPRHTAKERKRQMPIKTRRHSQLALRTKMLVLACMRKQNLSQGRMRNVSCLTHPAPPSGGQPNPVPHAPAATIRRPASKTTAARS